MSTSTLTFVGTARDRFRVGRGGIGATAGAQRAEARVIAVAAVGYGRITSRAVGIDSGEALA